MTKRLLITTVLMLFISFGFSQTKEELEAQKAEKQAEADAAREAARMEAYEPYERLGYLGTGITGMLGGYPGQYQSQITPNPTPLQSALGIGTGLAGMYGAYRDFREKGYG